jgi:hypothetical protein
MDLQEAVGSQTSTLQRMEELEHEIVTRQKRVEELQATLAQISGSIADVRLLETKREALVAENARRLEALPQEVDVPIEQLLTIQVRAPWRRRAAQRVCAARGMRKSRASSSMAAR